MLASLATLCKHCKHYLRRVPGDFLSVAQRAEDGAAEHVVRVLRVEQYRRQRDRDAHQEERLARSRGRSFPVRDFVRNDVPSETDRKARVAQSEQRHREQERQPMFAVGLETTFECDAAKHEAEQQHHERHSSAMTVTERYTLIDDSHIRYEATIEDPNTFSRPWTIAMPLYRRIEPTAELFQYNCVEFAEPLLYGEHLKEPGRYLRPDYGWLARDGSFRR